MLVGRFGHKRPVVTVVHRISQSMLIIPKTRDAAGQSTSPTCTTLVTMSSIQPPARRKRFEPLCRHAKSEAVNLYGAWGIE